MRRFGLAAFFVLAFAFQAHAQGQGNSGNIRNQGALVTGNCVQVGSVANTIADGGAPCGGAGGPPTGAAGGDLGGTYPDPSVVSVADVTTGVLPQANGGAGSITGALKANGSGLVSQAACADLSNAAASCATDATNAANISSGTLPAARLPTPAATTLGGVKSLAAVTHQFFTALSTAGAFSQAQPACVDISDAGTGCTVNTGTSGATIPLLNGANTWSALQTYQGATTTSPGLYVQITGDAVPRIRLGLNSTDVASIGFGDGALTRDTFIERAAPATIRFGAPDAAAPVAQTIGVQNVVAGTSNTAGVPLTIRSSISTGNANGGGINLDVYPAGSSGTAQNTSIHALSFTGTGAGTFAKGFVVTQGDIQLPAASRFLWNGRGILSSPGAGAIQLGDTNAASPVAQTLSGQGSRPGSDANVSGANVTITSGNGTGNSTPSTLSFQTPLATTSGTGAQTMTTAFSITGAGLLANPTIVTDSGKTDASVCEDTSSHGFYSGSGTLGVCLGTSSLRYKHDVARMGSGLKTILALNPITFRLNADHGDPDKPYGGFAAEEVVHVAPTLVGLDSSRQPNTVDILGMVPIMVRAIQEQQAEIVALRAQVAALRGTRAESTVYRTKH